MNFPTPPDLREQAAGAAGTDDEVFNLRSAVAALLDYWQLFASIVALGIFAGLFQAWVTPPLFESSALIEIESRSSGFAVGPESLAANPYWMPEQTGAQIEILKSRSILGVAAEQLGLTIQAKPIHMGRIGAAVARRYRGSGVASAPWYVPFSSQYAWGGEILEVVSFKPPEDLRSLILKSGEGGTFSIHAEDGEPLGEGTVGSESVIPTPKGEIRVHIARLEARPKTEFNLYVWNVKDAADSLRSRMRVVERGKGPFGGSGILEVKIRAGDAQEAADSANAIANAYLRQNVERLSQGAERKLEFLSSQLPRLQGELQAAEQALLEQRGKSGPYQLSEGAKSILDTLTTLEKEISELQLQRTELSQTLTAQHPAMAAVVRKLEQLEAERAKTNAKIASLPDAEARLLTLTRDAKVASELYISLLNQSQELKVAKAGTIGNVRIVDTAVPEKIRIEPRAFRLLFTWSSFGVVLGLAAVFLRKHLNVKLNWAEDAERRIGIPVYATIPLSQKQVQLDRATDRGKAGGLLAETDPKDVAVESLRSLRASMHFAMMDAKRNLAVITGSTPNVGKSFVAANLARLMADSGRRILLVDADLRKGRIHKMFGLERGPGLSEAIAGSVPLEKVRYRAGLDNFFVVPTGKLPPNPAELLGSERFVQIVEQACKEFDLVVVDTPPILNLADTVLVAKSAGALFVTIRGGISTVPDVQDCVQRFAKNGIKVDGLIFNGLRPGIGSYVHPQYYHYRYSYGRYRYGQTKT
jgi:tyrosine-protein kinase Etk/Wzc